MDEKQNNDSLYLKGSINEDDVNFSEIIKRHKDAIDRGEFYYIDPATGYKVFTAAYLKERGYCCGSGCRHCPY